MTDTGRLALPDAPVVAEPREVVLTRARRRLGVLGGLLAVSLTGVAARGAQLALDPPDKVLELAAGTRWQTRVHSGRRGTIYDASGGALATSVRGIDVVADPVAMVEDFGLDLADAAAALGRVLDLSPVEVAARLDRPSRYVVLRKNVHPAVADRLREEGWSRKGLILEKTWERYYPLGDAAGHALGFVNHRGEGREGLEGFFDGHLAGDRLRTHRAVARSGAPVEQETRDDRDLAGADVHTTIHRDVQRAVDRALAAMIARHEPVGAAAVVVEVATGRVLAMASVPSFDPNTSASGGVGTAKNNAIMTAVEPGSVFKPFTLAAALDAGATRIDEVIPTGRALVVAGAHLHDDHPHDAVTSAEMVKFSSNIAAAKLAGRVGPDRFDAYLEAFGFGEPTGIELLGERRGQRHPWGAFGPVELATVSYGQGATATVLQLAMATAALGNGGLRMRPILVDRVVKDGVVLLDNPPTPATRAVSPEAARQTLAAMQMVLEPGGTATGTRVPGYTAGGKTGTAYKIVEGTGRYSPTARYAGFIGIAPIEAPVVAMAILVDEPTVGSRYGGIVAAPVFAEAMAEALPALGVRPTQPVADAAAKVPPLLLSAPLPPVRVRWTGEGWEVPDLRGRSVREVLAGFQGTGLVVDVSGTGQLTTQRPSPGGVLAPGERLVVGFEAADEGPRALALRKAPPQGPSRAAPADAPPGGAEPEGSPPLVVSPLP